MENKNTIENTENSVDFSDKSEKTKIETKKQSDAINLPDLPFGDLILCHSTLKKSLKKKMSIVEDLIVNINDCEKDINKRLHMMFDPPVAQKLYMTILKES